MSFKLYPTSVNTSVKYRETGTQFHHFLRYINNNDNNNNNNNIFAEKLAKYGDLRVEVSRMWQCRTQVVPVVLGALGTVHAGIARWLDIIPGHHNLQHLQKAVLLGSARILRKVMSSSV